MVEKTAKQITKEVQSLWQHSVESVVLASVINQEIYDLGIVAENLLVKFLVDKYRKERQITSWKPCIIIHPLGGLGVKWHSMLSEVYGDAGAEEIYQIVADDIDDFVRSRKRLE